MGNDEEKQKERIKEIIIKEEHIRKIFNAYSDIKNFLIKYIYGKHDISTQDEINVYLINTKSIPNFINILKEQFNKEIKNESELMVIEQNLREKFKDYIIEKNMIIYNSYQDCLDAINHKKNNEFIIVGEKFFINLGIDSGKYKGRQTKIIDINKKEKKMIIKLPTSEKILEAKEKQKGYFQFNKIINNSTSIEKNIISNSFLNSQNNDDNILNIADNQNKFLDTMIQSIVYCLLNIKSLYKYLINHNNKNFTKEKKISLIFYKMANQKKKKNYNFDCLDLIKTIKSYKVNNANNIIENIYQNLHLELKDNTKEIYTNIIVSDKPDPNIEILNTLNEFEKKGKSIISEIFYFQDIVTYQCLNCGKISDYKSTIKNKFFFPLKDIINFKKNSSKLNIYDCFDFLTNGINDINICIHCYNHANGNYRINSSKEILTIILDRGDNFKNEIDFKLDLKINLSKYFFNQDNNNQDNKYNFELIGFCSFYKDKKVFFPFYKNHENNQWNYYDGLNINILTNNTNIGAPFLLLYKIVQ